MGATEEGVRAAPADSHTHFGRRPRQDDVAGPRGRLEAGAWASRTVVVVVGGGGGGGAAGPLVVGWFWDYIRAMDDAGRRRVLRLVTERDALPAWGTVMELAVRPDWGDGAAPAAHTCFCELVLPLYSSAAALAAGMGLALRQWELAEYTDA